MILGGCAGTSLIPVDNQVSFQGEVHHFAYGDADVLPLKVVGADPIYPEKFRQNKIVGSASIAFIVEADGRTSQIQVKSATDVAFGNAACEAIANWRFTPGKKAGQPVRVAIIYPMTFDPSYFRLVPVHFKVKFSGQAEDVGNLDLPPKILHETEPVFPSVFEDEEVAGGATIDFIVDPDGSTSEVQVADADDAAFGEAARNAVARWKYSPGLKNGRPVRVKMHIRLELKLLDSHKISL